MSNFRSLSHRLTPRVPPKVKTTFYWDPELRNAIEKIAREHNRSLNGEVEWALRQYLAQETG